MLWLCSVSLQHLLLGSSSTWAGNTCDRSSLQPPGENIAVWGAGSSPNCSASSSTDSELGAWPSARTDSAGAWHHLLSKHPCCGEARGIRVHQVPDTGPTARETLLCIPEQERSKAVAEFGDVQDYMLVKAVVSSFCTCTCRHPRKCL